MRLIVALIAAGDHYSREHINWEVRDSSGLRITCKHFWNIKMLVTRREYALYDYDGKEMCLPLDSLEKALAVLSEIGAYHMAHGENWQWQRLQDH